MKKQNKATVISIILVCALMLALTVYAWVEVVTGVDISGIKVKPTESKGLKIQKEGDSSFSVSVNASTTTAQSLSPVSTADLANWYIPADNNKINSDGSYSESFVKIDAGEASSYYYNESFVLKSSVSYVGGLRISRIDVTDANGNAVLSDITKAVRVGIKTNLNESAKIFAPVAGSDESCRVANGTDSTVEVSYITNSAKVMSSPVDKSSDYVINVYVWYEGQDSNVTHENLLNAEEIRIKIYFEGIE